MIFFAGTINGKLIKWTITDTVEDKLEIDETEREESEDTTP